MYTIICDKFPSNKFGVFSTIRDARNWFATCAMHFISCEDIGCYTYLAKTTCDSYLFEIVYDDSILP